MRICLVCRGYPTQRPGGMLFVCQDRAEALAELGHEVFVLTTGLVKGVDETIISHDGRLTVMHLPCTPLAYSADFGRLLSREVARLKPTILHLDSFDRSCPWWQGYEDGVKAVTMHGFGWGSLLTRWQLYLAGDRSMPTEITARDFRESADERDALVGFDRRLGISRHEVWLMAATYGLSCELVYNPIHRSFFGPRVPLPKSKPVEFVAAAVSGQGPRGFASLELLAKQAGVNVRRVSNVPRSAMPGVYDASHGVVLPTRYWQGYDLCVAEALARGRQVIASAVGSYYAESAAGLPGLTVVPAGDQDEWVKAMSMPPREIHGASEQHRPEVHAARWLDAIKP